ncbi:ankyrin repeat-containing protein [Paramyrothecium foliicola]|nr:ankyrin repeat-containing protein [Paramyrothecium foliicola]
MAPNPFLLAADNSPTLLPLLRENPALASSQDEHGYSLIHAAASYNHLELLRALVHEFKVDVDLRDEDDETALFVVETVDAAKVLIEELGANFNHRGSERLTAKEKITSEGEFPEVAAYLNTVESSRQNGDVEATAAAVMPEMTPPAPSGMSVTVGTMDEAQEIPELADPELRRRIDELAQRDDFNTPEGQAELRKLVEEAILGQGLGDERSVRARQD